MTLPKCASCLITSLPHCESAGEFPGPPDFFVQSAYSTYTVDHPPCPQQSLERYPPSVIRTYVVTKGPAACGHSEVLLSQPPSHSTPIPPKPISTGWILRLNRARLCFIVGERGPASELRNGDCCFFVLHHRIHLSRIRTLSPEHTATMSKVMRSVKNVTKGYSGVQVKVREGWSTNCDPRSSAVAT